MKVTCPECGTPIPPARMNVAANAAVCPNCGEAFALSKLVERGDVPPEFDLNHPPPGAWYREEVRGWRIGASTRSPAAFIFVIFVFSVCYQMSWLEVDFFGYLSGSPFRPFAILVFGGMALVNTFGRVEVTVADAEGRVFTGVGPLGWTRRFDWSGVTQVEQEPLGKFARRSEHGRVIVLRGKTRLRFGTQLSEARRNYLIHGLRRLRKVAGMATGRTSQHDL